MWCTDVADSANVCEPGQVLWGDHISPHNGCEIKTMQFEELIELGVLCFNREITAGKVGKTALCGDREITL